MLLFLSYHIPLTTSIPPSPHSPPPTDITISSHSQPQLTNHQYLDSTSPTTTTIQTEPHPPPLSQLHFIYHRIHHHYHSQLQLTHNSEVTITWSSTLADGETYSSIHPNYNPRRLLPPVHPLPIFKLPIINFHYLSYIRKIVQPTISASFSHSPPNKVVCKYLEVFLSICLY